jgi:hypothetical protein
LHSLPLLIAGIGAGAAALAIVGAPRRWRRRTATLVAGLRAEASARDARQAAGVPDGLPQPVARYFRAVLPDGARPVAYARLEQRGQFLVRPGQADGWRPFTAVEHFTVQPAGFVWDARIRMAPGAAVFVRDGFVSGRGSMTASVLGLRSVLSVEGTAAIASAALQRYLAEAVWLPTALLPGAGVSWTAVGPSSARATLTVGPTTVSLDFEFGADGLVERIFTPARERDVGGGRTVPTPWQGRFARYERRDGFRIPLEGEVEWLLPEGSQPYWRGEILSAVYQPDAGLASPPRRPVH